MGERWTITLCPFIHFDNARTNTYEHNISIVAWNVKSVLDYLDVNPTHKFCIDQVTLLEGFRRLFPNYWDVLHQKVLEGRIEIVGGTYVMPDLIIPSGESIVRQFVYGMNFIRSELGVNVKSGWAVDSAGHCSQMPQILRQVGIDAYYFWRGQLQKSPTEYIWRGPDGSRVNAVWLSKGYDSAAWLSENTREAFTNLLHLVDETGPMSASHNVFLPVGGELVPPPPHLADIVKKWNDTFPETNASIGTPRDFTDKLKTVQAELPLISGELASGRFSAICSGGLSSRIRLKILNRKLETLLYLCELALSKNGDISQNGNLSNIWRMLLFNQDHNIIRGTISDTSYRLAIARYNQGIEKAEEILQHASSTRIIGLSSNNEGISIIVNNPVPWNRSGVVTIQLDRISLGKRFFEIESPSGDTVPYQILREHEESQSIELIFLAEDVPSLGRSVYTIREVDTNPEFDTGLKSGKFWIESRELILEFDEFNGGISRLFDKKSQMELIARESSSISMESDVGDLYRYAPSSLTSEEARITSLRSPAKISILEDGPVRVVAQIRNMVADSEITQTVTMYSALCRVDMEIDISFKGRNKRVRYNIPLQIFSPKVTTGAQFGVEERIIMTNGIDAYMDHGYGTFHALDWVDISGPESGFALSTIGLHEFQYTDGILNTTLLRSVNHLSHGLDDDVLDTPMATENDTHHFSIALIPHEGNWQSGMVIKKSAEYRLPPSSYCLLGGVAERPLKKSFLEIEGVVLGLSCFKPSDVDYEYIIRLYEYNGQSGRCTLRFNQTVHYAVLLDLIENEIGELQHDGNNIIVSVDPYSIITIKVKLV
ncbi:MAG: glycoside hydrolase family 38 C-terminal domain-containing protein [Candidatus Thorarchaeota archaeon]